MPIYSSELINGGVLIGQAVYLEDTQPTDLTIYGKRYLRSGSIETNTANFNANVFTSKKSISEVSRTSGFGASNINDVLYVASVGAAVAVGASGKLYTSSNLIDWSSQTSSFGTSAINSICRGGTTFVIAGDGGKIATSTDTSTWTSRASGVTSSLKSVIWNQYLSKFIAFGSSGDNTSSSDGLTWSAGANIINNYRTISEANHAFAKAVIGGDNGVIKRSVDGASWITVTSQFGSSNINSIVYNGSLLVAVGDSGKISTSTDGNTWVARVSDVGTDNLTDVVYKDGLFVATTSTSKLAISADGIVWQSHSTIAANATSALTIDSNSMITVGASGELITSSWASYAGSTVAHAENGENQYIRIS